MNKRKIKFRAWAFASKKMFPLDDAFEFSNGELFAIPNTEIMQFTGLKDKNGKEIYEGDIVRWHNEFVQEIKWNGIGWDGVPTTSIDDHKSCETIGNIYESPELITNPPII